MVIDVGVVVLVFGWLWYYVVQELGCMGDFFVQGDIVQFVFQVGFVIGCCDVVYVYGYGEGWMWYIVVQVVDYVVVVGMYVLFEVCWVVYCEELVFGIVIGVGDCCMY